MSDTSNASFDHFSDDSDAVEDVPLLAKKAIDKAQKSKSQSSLGAIQPAEQDAPKSAEYREEDPYGKRVYDAVSQLIWILFITFTIIAFFLGRNRITPEQEREFNFCATKKTLIDKAFDQQATWNHVMAITKAKSSFERMAENDKLTLHTWIPDPSRFKGVDELVDQFKYNGTGMADFLYFSQPVFKKEEDGIISMHHVMDSVFEPKPMIIANCLMMSKCHTIERKIVNVDLYINEIFKSEHQEFRITRVYYVPIGDLL